VSDNGRLILVRDLTANWEEPRRNRRAAPCGKEEGGPFGSKKTRRVKTNSRGRDSGRHRSVTWSYDEEFEGLEVGRRKRKTGAPLGGNFLKSDHASAGGWVYPFCSSSEREAGAKTTRSTIKKRAVKKRPNKKRFAKGEKTGSLIRKGWCGNGGRRKASL